jgi:hypothetical protein
MNIDLTPLQKGFEPIWEQIQLLFSEHHFITIVCAFFAVVMTINFYRFLRSISPALVVFVMGMILAILMLHWIHTRTEPPFLKSFVDAAAPWFPAAPTPAGPPPRVYP